MNQPGVPLDSLSADLQERLAEAADLLRSRNDLPPDTPLRVILPEVMGELIEALIFVDGSIVSSDKYGLDLGIVSASRKINSK